jgi:hypothetical protein
VNKPRPVEQIVAAALTVLIAGARPALADPAAGSSRRLRTGYGSIQSLLDQGHARSATFRTLVSRLEATPWLVFVQTGRCPDPATTACLLHVVGHFYGAPYLRVVIEIHRQHPDGLIATIAHELWHALEAIESSRVVDTPGLRAFFGEVGAVNAKSGRVVTYETDGARRIGKQVLRELQGNDRRADERH